jgi:autotransporter-associated beta strand protein
MFSLNRQSFKHSSITLEVGWLCFLWCLGGASPAGAAILYSGVQDISIPGDFEGVYLNVTTHQSSANEFTGWDMNAFFGGLGIANSPTFQPARVGTGSEDLIRSIGFGTVVGSGLTYSTDYGGSGAEDESGHVGPADGQFHSGVKSYIGFTLTRADQLFNGWMQVTLFANGSVGQIHDWAYEDSGSSIFAGVRTDVGTAPRVIQQGAAQSASANDAGTAILLDAGARFTFSQGETEGNFAGDILGSGKIVVDGSGGLRLNGVTFFTGTAEVSEGSKLTVSENQNLGNVAVELDASTLIFDSSSTNDGEKNTYANAITVTEQTGTLRNTGTGTVVLTGGLSKNGTVLAFADGLFEVKGAITGSEENSDLVVDHSTVSLLTSNSYNGPTYILNGGILNAASAGALPSSPSRSAIIMDASGGGLSELRLSSANQSILSLAGAASSSVNLSADGSPHTLTMGGVISNLSEYAGTITGSGGLVKDGTNTQILSGTSNFSGSIQVNSGGLLINGVHTGVGDVSIASGATLGGSGKVAGSTTVGGTLSAGVSIESFGAGAMNFMVGSTFSYELNSQVLNGDLVHVDGSLAILGGSIALSEISSGSLALGSKLTLISSSGLSGSNGLFNYNGSTLPDDSYFYLGPNLWFFNYNDTSGGSNFIDDQAGASSYVTMTVVPETSAAILTLIGVACLTLRRQRLVKS